LGSRRFCFGAGEVDHAETDGDGSRGDAKKLAAMLVDELLHDGAALLMVRDGGQISATVTSMLPRTALE
jgi:hypothetical protein